MKRVFKNKKGITLIELLVTILLASIVVIFIYRLILNVNNQTANPEFAMSNQTIRTEIIRTVEADLVSRDISNILTVYQDENNNYNPSIYFIEKDRQSVLSIIDEKSIKYTAFTGQTQRWDVIDCYINFDPSERGEKSGIVVSQNGVGNSTTAVTVNIVISNENEHNSGFTEEDNNLKDDILISYLAHNNDLKFCIKASTHTEEECKKYVLIYLDYNYPHKETENLVTSDQVVGETIKFPSKPITEGYEFIYWQDEKNGGNKVLSDRIIKLEDENMIIYGHWLAKSVEVTFDPKGGTTPNPDKKTVHYDGPYADNGKDLPETSRVGYTFNGWRLESGKRITKDSIVKTSVDHTLYAYWNAKQYTITLDNTLATVEGTTSVKATYDSSTLNTNITNPKREYTIIFNAGKSGATLSKTSATSKWTFTGWWTATSGGTQVIGIDGKLISDVSGYTDTNGNWTRDGGVTLYAQWSGGTITEATANKRGHTCGFGTITNPPTEDKTYTATCTPNKYTVTFNANTGKNLSKTNMQVTYGQKYGTLATVQRNSCDFDGWWTNKNPGKGTKITKDTIVDIVEDITLYAHWKSNCVLGHGGSRCYGGYSGNKCACDRNGKNCGEHSHWELKESTSSNPNPTTVNNPSCCKDCGPHLVWTYICVCDNKCEYP